MSTDVVQYSTNDSPDSSVNPAKIVSWDALKLFLELCIPFMAVTLVSSLAYYRYVRAKTDTKYAKLWKDFVLRRITGTSTCAPSQRIE